MTNLSTCSSQRELWLTPYTKWFLEKCGKTDNAKQLTEDIVRALDGRDEKDGCILLTAPTFLLFIIDAAYPGGPERVIVWHGPTEGSSFNTSLLEIASSYGIDLL